MALSACMTRAVAGQAGPMAHPVPAQTVLDTTDVRALAEFYRELLGWDYRPGDEVPPEGPDDTDWLVLRPPAGGHGLAFQEVDQLEPTTWPENDVPMQLHLDMTVTDAESLESVRRLAESLGATLTLDRSEDPGEPLYVFRDLAGHPFCVFVG